MIEVSDPTDMRRELGVMAALPLPVDFASEWFADSETASVAGAIGPLALLAQDQPASGLLADVSEAWPVRRPLKTRAGECSRKPNEPPIKGIVDLVV